MASHVIPEEVYQKLVEGFRISPGNYAGAAQFAGVNPRTAKAYWENGLPQKGRPPIAESIRLEQEHARARLQELQLETERLAAEIEARRRADDKSKALEDVNQSRVQEAQMIRMARGAATGLLVTLTSLSKGAARIGGKVQKGLEEMAQDPKPLSPGEMVNLTRLVQNLTGSLRQANDAAARAMEMERLLLGEPTSIIGHMHLADATQEEAERRINAALKALERAKARGITLTVVGSGPADPTAPGVALPPGEKAAVH